MSYQTSQATHNTLRQVLFLGLLIAIAVVLFTQLKFFVGSFLGAITFYVVLRDELFRLTEKRHWKSWKAATALVLGMTVLLLGVGFLVFEVLASQVDELDTSHIVLSLNRLPDKINGLLGFPVVTNDLMSSLGTYLSKFATGFLNSTYSFAINVLLMLVILYFMFAHGRAMEKKIYAYLPFKGESLEKIRHEAKSMIYSNAVGIPVIMFSQGLAAFLLYWALGLNNAVFWAFVTALCGLVPMVGTLIVSLPLGFYLISTGALWQGIVLIVCGLFVVANADNLTRIVLLQKVAHTPPLVVIFGVLLGIPLFGFWGIIFGPLFISGFLLLIRIYYLEYSLIRPSDS
jgi:predicted PurR-regulated permease PerM